MKPDLIALDALNEATVAMGKAWRALGALSPIEGDRKYCHLTVQINGSTGIGSENTALDVYFGEHLIAKAESPADLISRAKGLDLNAAKAAKIAQLEKELEALKGGAK